jgi:hypothetical protein
VVVPVFSRDRLPASKRRPLARGFAAGAPRRVLHRAGHDEGHEPPVLAENASKRWGQRALKAPFGVRLQPARHLHAPAHGLQIGALGVDCVEIDYERHEGPHLVKLQESRRKAREQLTLAGPTGPISAPVLLLGEPIRQPRKRWAALVGRPSDWPSRAAA